MSHQYPYRRTPSDADLRPDPGPYGSSDRRDRHVLPHQDFYRPPPPPQESLSSSSSSRGPAQWTQDGALSILSSCGLEPSDLSLLAELPEDVLTVESLPQVLKQIKGKRGTVKPFPPHAASSSSSSYPPSSAHRPASGPTHRATSSLAHQQASSSTHRATSSSTHQQASSSSHRPASSFSAAGDWDRLRSQPVQYPLDQLQNHWGAPRPHSSVRVDPSSSASSSLSSVASSSSSMYMVDFHRRPGPPEYGKTGGASGSGSGSGPVQDRASFRSTGPGQRTRPSRFSEPGSADHRRARPPPATAPSSSSSSMPSPKEALDFHGTCPQVYPYSCSLCDITVLSEKVWIKHINGTQHADGQLHLLQQFPNWDCRMETVSRGDNQSEKRTEEEKPVQPLQTTNQSQKPQPNKPPQKKASDKGKVVCVKFPAQSVDEMYLRKLMEPFGKIVKILMFPSLAFVELGSPDQAKDLVKFHVNYPPTVNGEQIQFSISNTFSFLQSSRVVSFSPAPTGDDGRSDLLSIVKRFGPPLYTLFLPSIAFVEMKNAPDAQKLVDYYSSNNLKINSDFLKVSFSGEYKSLMRVASAKRYEEEEEESSTKRIRGQSQEEAESETKRRRGQSREGAGSDTKRRSSSKDRAGESRRDWRSRSRSRDKSRETRTRIRSKSRSRDKNSRDRRSRSRDKSSTETRTRIRSRSRSRDKSSSSSSQQSGSNVKTEEPDSETRTDPEPAPVTDVKPETTQREPSEDEAESSADDSDIEGMEVIGEDGENLQEEDEDHLDEEDKEEQKDEEEVKEEAAERKSGEPENHDSPGEETEKEVKDGGTVEEEKREEKEEEQDSGTSRELEKAAETVEDEEEDPGFPVDLDDCIVMDEVEEEQSDDSDVTRQPEVRGHREVTAEPEVRGHHEVTAEPESSTRVVYFTNLPQRFYTDTDFVRLVRDYGTATRYFLIRHRQEGFIEMSSPSEALTAAQELTSNKPVIFHGSKLSVHVSHKYHRLVNGWDIHSDSDSDSERRKERSDDRSQSSRRERRSKSRTSDREETGRRSGSKRSSERETSCRTSPEECTEKKTEEQDVNNTSEPAARTSLESGSKMSTEPESTENESANQESPAEESHAKTTSEKPEIESEEVSKETEEMSRGHEEETRRGTEEKEGSADQGPETNGPDSAADPPEPQTHQKPGDDERLQDLDQKPGPAGGAAGPERPSRPVGTEFVRPVVGYFCHLCQVIYADEDEAKLQHCSSDAHYRKYQEKTGKNPWTS